MNDTNLSLRQQKILEILQVNTDGLSRAEIEKLLAEAKIELSKITLLRDLNDLLDLNYIKTEGAAKATKYFLSTHPLLKYYNLDTYFEKEIDQRDINERFSASVFELFDGVFYKQELDKLNNLNETYRKNKSLLPKDIYRKELERFVIELSWKSSRIEGNTYSLLETEALIKESRKADGHTDEEAQMILNHKIAFEIITAHSKDFSTISVKNIFDIHQALTDRMSVSAGIRKNQVGIIGTAYRPLANAWHIEEALEKLVAAINKLQHPFEKAFLAVCGISYLQAFSDGNKRTARLLANAILMAYDWAPLSYRNVDEVEYKQAMVLFYEQHSAFHLKRIFIEQFEFMVGNYFLSDS